jgi:hypothetical protein
MSRQYTGWLMLNSTLIEWPGDADPVLMTTATHPGKNRHRMAHGNQQRSNQKIGIHPLSLQPWQSIYKFFSMRSSRTGIVSFCRSSSGGSVKPVWR